MSFLEDIKKPFNIVSLSLAVIAIIISVYFYYTSQKEKEPVYTISPMLKVFDSEISSPKIKIFDANDTIIKNDIYVVTLTFWNAGELPIEPADVREPIKITLNPCKKILDYKIIQSTKPKVSGFRINENRALSDTTKKEIILGWNHLDPGFSVEIQIIFESEKKGEIELDGYILGVDKILNKTNLIPKEDIFRIILLSIIIFSLLIIMIIMGAINFKKRIVSSVKTKGG